MIRPHLKEMSAYVPGRPIDEVKRELSLERVIKLASNENPLGASPSAIAAAQDAAADMHLYPDAAAFELRRAIAAFHGLPMDQVMVGNGSDEIIHFLGLMLLSAPEDEVIVGDPSFVRYDAAAHLAPSRLHRVKVNADLGLDLPAMADRITPNTKLIWIANPNNPTGTMCSRADFESLLHRVPTGCLVILDEAYYEFGAHHPDTPRSLDYVRHGAPVVALRTFSKAYGLAGLRVGFGVASAELVDVYNRIREPFNVNSIALRAAVAALADQEHVRRSVVHNQAMLDRLSQAFRSVGARPYPSFANFVLGDMGQAAQPIFEALMRRGVIVRSGGPLGLPNFLRVSVGTVEETEEFAEALQAVMTAGVSA